MKKLLVGTVYANDSPLQQQWLDLQLKCLSSTTDSYDHVAVLSLPATNDSFQTKTKVLVPPDTTLHASDAHVQGLNLLKDYFVEKKEEYENFLFLDGDALPIRKHWLATLLNRMQPMPKFDQQGVPLPGKDRGRYYEIAVALRCENLETRWHASILFAKKAALDYLTFEIGIVGDDLAGNPEEDVHIPFYQLSRRRLVYPLIRSNQFNLHPLACGVYYDMFYHHSCGSGRWFNLRAKEYYDRIVMPVDDLSHFTTRLFADPQGFIGKLAGWSPTKYGSF
jgi:hypothetical protein